MGRSLPTPQPPALGVTALLSVSVAPSGIRWCLSLGDGLISLGMLSLGFIHVVTWLRISFPFKAE